ncbi:MAG: response regulator [Planctomycetota bacterium]
MPDRTTRPPVLIADDNELICQILADALADRYTPHTVYNGISALEHIVNWHETDESVACLIIDVMMPGMDGLELLRKLGDMGISLPVIVISGHCKAGQIDRMEQYGVIEFIDKPIRARTIREAVPRAITNWTQRQAVRSRPQPDDD